jgi:hypothetical protein
LLRSLTLPARQASTGGYGSPSGPHGKLVVFELDKDGKVARIKIGENYAQPVK